MSALVSLNRSSKRVREIKTNMKVVPFSKAKDLILSLNAKINLLDEKLKPYLMEEEKVSSALKELENDKAELIDKLKRMNYKITQMIKYLSDENQQTL